MDSRPLWQIGVSRIESPLRRLWREVYEGPVVSPFKLSPDRLDQLDDVRPFNPFPRIVVTSHAR